MSNLFDTLKKFFAPPVFAGNEEKTRVAELINTVLISVTGTMALAFIAVLVGSKLIGTMIAILVAIAGFLVLQIPLRRGYVKQVARLIVILLTALVTFTMWSGGTVRAPAVVALILASIISGLTISRQAAYWSTIVNILIFVGLAYAETHHLLPAPLQQTTLQQPIVFAALSVMTVVLLNQALGRIQSVTNELTKLNVGLEQRVAERTKALETSAGISRRLASILDTHELANEVVTQIQSAFNYYYAQIYLFDVTGENLVLTAGTGEAGAAMLKRGHSLAKGRGLVGRAADTKESILVTDTSQDSNWLPNELLPDTKAESVVPIIIGDKVLGVLDVQDDVTNDITTDDVTLLESLASQVAISLQNARSFQQAIKSQNQFSLVVEGSNDGIWDWDIESDSIFYSARWKAMLGYEEHELTRGFVEWEERIHPDDRDYAVKALDDYLAQRAPTYDVEIRLRHRDGTWRWIRDRGKALRKPDGMAYRMAGAHTDLTEIKLQQEKETQRARQQEAINMITQKIQSATTIEAALQITARELGHALGMKPTLVTLEPATKSDNTESAS